VTSNAPSLPGTRSREREKKHEANKNLQRIGEEITEASGVDNWRESKSFLYDCYVELFSNSFAIEISHDFLLEFHMFSRFCPTRFYTRNDGKSIALRSVTKREAEPITRKYCGGDNKHV